jgi:hypothetical protein
MDEHGAINVNGPIQQALLCYGLLESAKIAIYEHSKQAQNRVQPAPAGLVLPKQP